MATAKIRLARDPTSGEMKWAPTDHGGAHAWVGWAIMAISTVLFLLVAGYFVYWFLVVPPTASGVGVPDGGSREFRQQVQQLRPSR
jgi:hypothetical protein